MIAPMRVETGSFGGVPYVRVGNGGETVVVINGGNAFVRRFEPASAMRNGRQIARLFPATCSVWVLGYDTSICDVPVIVDEMAVIIEAEFGAATVVGISFGGLVATRLAAEHPDLVQRLILLSTAHRFSEEGRRRVRQQIADAARGDFAAMARPFLTLFRRPWLNVMIRLAVWAGRRTLAEKMNDRGFIVCMLEAALAAGAEERAHLQRVRAKTLLVAGTRDQFFDVAALEETATAIPEAELVLFANETHMLPVERHRVVAQTIERFFTA